MGAGTAMPCPAGTFEQDYDCIPVPLGHYSAEGSTEPKECVAGTYTDIEGATECTICTTGHYCEQGQDYPVECPLGTYNTELGGLYES